MTLSKINYATQRSPERSSASGRLSIRVLLSGGLGNQLFQYAFGRALAVRSGGRLQLDANTLLRQDQRFRRVFALDAFRLSESAQRVDSRLFGWPIRMRLLNYKERGRQLERRQLIREPRPHGFWPQFSELTLTRSCIVMGYWQSQRYFNSIENIIRRELSFAAPLSSQIADPAAEIAETNSIAIHLRRINYKTMVDADYYEKAIENIASRISNPIFFVFGDEFDWWLRDVRKLPGLVFRIVQTSSAMDDFRLMTLCKHFIIANSSFSWWAAWLGYQPYKLVLVPDKKFWDQAELFHTFWQTGEELENR